MKAMQTLRFGRLVDAPTAPAMTLRMRLLTRCVVSEKTTRRSSADMLLLFVRWWERVGLHGAAVIMN
jgi:hypothetical protein